MRFGHKISVFGLAGSLALRIFVATIYAGQDGHRVKRPPILGVGGIGLRTNDMNAARNFYGHVLGYREYSLDHAAGGGRWTYFKVNGHQYVEIFPDLKSETQDRLRYVAFETSDVRQLREYLASRNVQVPETVEPGLDGNLRFSITDPEGHEIQFVQYTPEAFSMPGKNGNKVDERISRRMIHCGFTVRDRAAEDKLFKDILGFDLMWYGGKTETAVDYVDMRVPDGSDWLEYMLNADHPTPKDLGVKNHLALGVSDIKTAYQAVLQRGYQPPAPPKIGVDGKWQLNLYDPNLTRTEFMEFTPVQKPCCSPMHLPGTIVRQ